MSKLTDTLRTIRVFNDHDFFADQPCVWYSPRDMGRGGRSAYWAVSKGGERTDDSPNPHWRNYGRKTFNVYSRDEKASQLAAAQEWCRERYGITEWAKGPFGGWGEARYVKTRLAELKNRVAESSAV